MRSCILGNHHQPLSSALRTRSKLYGVVASLIIILTFAVVSGRLPTSHAAFAESARIVSIYHDGQKRIVATSGSTVGDVLDRAGVKVGPGDLVEPGLATHIPDGFYNINVYRSRPVEVIDGTHRLLINSAYQNPQLIAKAAGLSVYPEDQYQIGLVTSVVADGAVGEQLTIKRATPVEVTVDGATKVLRTQGKTVTDLISDKKIPMGTQDLTSAPLDSSLTPDMHLTIVRVENVTTTVTQPLAHATKTTKDNTLDIGQSRVAQVGSDGHRDVTYLIHYHDGAEVGRQITAIAGVVAPVTQIVAIGTKIPDDIWYRLRQCESGGDYSRNSGNGYYGAYQFDLLTWHANGGSGYPNLASPATQDAVAKATEARRGWVPWPVCSVRLGL